MFLNLVEARQNLYQDCFIPPQEEHIANEGLLPRVCKVSVVASSAWLFACRVVFRLCNPHVRSRGRDVISQYCELIRIGGLDNIACSKDFTGNPTIQNYQLRP